jgi:hypothetical protein
LELRKVLLFFTYFFFFKHELGGLFAVVHHDGHVAVVRQSFRVFKRVEHHPEALEPLHLEHTIDDAVVGTRLENPPTHACACAQHATAAGAALVWGAAERFNGLVYTRVHALQITEPWKSPSTKYACCMHHSAIPSPKNFLPCPLIRKVSTLEKVDVPSALRLHAAPFLL